MIVRNFNLIDIKKYEDRTGDNILDYFSTFKFINLVELVKLGNGCCDDDRACEIIDQYLQDGGSLLDAFLEIKSLLIGVGDNDEVEQNTETINISNYKSLTDLYIYFCMQMMQVGLSYSEFWSMNTKEMYKVFDSLVIKMCNDTNTQLQNSYNLAALVGSAVWGKLPKKVPHVDIPEQHGVDQNGLDADAADAVNKIFKLLNRG